MEDLSLFSRGFLVIKLRCGVSSCRGGGEEGLGVLRVLRLGEVLGSWVRVRWF